MRMERFVNRFFYAWKNSAFYSPIETGYQPKTDDFLSIMPAEIQTKAIRSGLWWGVNLSSDLPLKGWKIHVSAHHNNARRVLELTSEYLLTAGVTFKFALDLNILEFMNSKAMSRGGSGKFITIYPKDTEEFQKVARDLDAVLRGEEGPYILSDHRYKEARCVYFRYGQFKRTYTVDPMGKKVNIVHSPAGVATPDEREAFFSVPEWESWPFPDWPQPVDQDDTDEVTLNGRYAIEDVFDFSNGGGVYLGRDTHTGQAVVIKEARPHTNFNPRLNYDAVDLLKREAVFLESLASTGITPRLLDQFYEWEHYYIVEEYINGVDLRQIILDENPLVKLTSTRADSVAYLNKFIRIFSSFADALSQIHARDIVLGDLSAKNILVDPATHRIRIIDLESARYRDTPAADVRNGAYTEPVELYTPGFRSVERARARYDVQDDLYSLASSMGYFVFPIAAMSYLRNDVFNVYRHFLQDLGWPPAIHSLLVDVADGSLGLDGIRAVLSQSENLIAQVQAPAPAAHHSGSEPVRRGAPQGSAPVILSGPARRAFPDDELCRMERGLVQFIETSATPEGASLFPVDPFAHLTNNLSLGFGSGGVLYTLSRTGRAIPEAWRAWYMNRVRALEPREFSPGLMTGLAGIAWTLNTIGETEEANRVMELISQHPRLHGDYTLYYGLAGIGMTNLHFFLLTGEQDYLERARACGASLQQQAAHDEHGVFWTNTFTGEKPFTGMGFGQSGVGLFLLRLSQVLGENIYRDLGRRAVCWDLAQGLPQGDGLTFEHDGTTYSYVEVGGAGVAKVLLRFGMLAEAEPILRRMSVKYYVLPGYAFGVAGVIDTMLDAYQHLGHEPYRAMAHGQLAMLNDVYLFEPSRSSNFRDAEPHLAGLAVPGEGLLRTSCDYNTGSAGVLRTVHRFRTGGDADFMLDGLT